ncbi:aminotransferase class IV [Burkholderia cepacia]|uniref:Peptide deformylase n=1 Tax=Burkholderia cepacia TaxID=292 RepID=A0A8I1AKF5_BURCE|nr:aminotransferase class IV [Burkholderia cepacia]MBA9900338.1 aminotransferase class IV [Burkholderia cepacia]MBA9943740.1 aminotransferase class IV [Burkholderia cepacia]MBA9974018.1 aminotransferase class IV [Burkholderia cepacia]MBA9992210.1 aminotransferase class IV [Burkholderia cepacia]MBB0000582.1 aminotransferase class IV [Burkholderia cepacia]
MNTRILPVGTASLRDVARPVGDVTDPAVREAACALRAALRAFRDEHGFGRAVAAPQIGVGQRMIALALDGWPDVIVNPEIVWHSDARMTLWDDCMCFPDLFVRVERHASVSVQYTTLDGELHRRDALSPDVSELMQHEIDHLDGKLSFDRAAGPNAVVHRSVFDADRASFVAQVDYAPHAPDVKRSAPESIQSAEASAYPPGAAYMNGRFVPIADARVSVLDWGFLHSDVTYDTAHVWNGRFFRLDRHIARFRRSLARLRLDVPLSDDALRDILVECVRRSGLRNAYVEMLCTRGVSPTFSRDPRDAVNQFIAFAVPYGSVANERQLREGLHLHLVDDVRRIPPESVDPQIKNYHWLDLVAGLLKGYDAGAESVVLKCTDGSIAEGPGFNVFIVRDGRLRTPERGVLHGITRQTVFELAASMGIDAQAGRVDDAQLREADEVFITSTAGGIMPVTRLNGAPIGDGRPGPMTRRLFDAYWAKHEDPAWSLAVDYAANSAAHSAAG